jgi:hypothetical protein
MHVTVAFALCCVIVLLLVLLLLLTCICRVVYMKALAAVRTAHVQLVIEISLYIYTT